MRSFCGDCVRACHEIQSIEQLILVVVVQLRCVVDHESLLLILKLIVDCGHVYAYVHGHTRTHWPQSTQST